MTCEHVRERLLEGSSDTRAELYAHLTECSACRRIADAIDGVDRDLHEGLDAALARPLSVPLPTKRRLSMAVPTLIIAAAASLALALIPSVGGRTLGSFLPDFGVTAVEVDDVIRGAEILNDSDLSASQWADRRDRLYDVLVSDGPPEGKARFRLLAQIGRTASLAGELREPFFTNVDGRMTNRYLAEAAAMNEASGGALLSTASPSVVQLVLGVDVAGKADAAALVELADGTASTPWNALSENDWASRADDMLQAYRLSHDQLQGEELFLVLCQLGRAAENANKASEPFYATVDGRTVNVAWHAAATLVVARPALLTTVPDRDVRASVQYYVSEIRTGELAPRNREDVLVR